MPYIATINSNNPKALEVINYLKNFDFVKVTERKETKKRTLTAAGHNKEEMFKQNLTQGLKELKAFREGKTEFQELDDFLDEI